MTLRIFPCVAIRGLDELEDVLSGPIPPRGEIAADCVVGFQKAEEANDEFLTLSPVDKSLGDRGEPDEWDRIVHTRSRDR